MTETRGTNESQNFITLELTTDVLSGNTETVKIKKGQTAHDILCEVYPPSVHKYVDIVCDGQRLSREEAQNSVPESSISLVIVPEGPAVPYLVALGVSLVVGYATYLYLKRKFGDLDDEDENFSIRGQRNQDRRYQPVPIIIGKRRVVPDLAALPWTETQGGEQYLRLLLSVGHKPLKLEDFRIGETSFSEFGDDIEVQINDGFENFDELTLYPYDVAEESVGVELRNNQTFTTRTTFTNADEIGVDILFPQGLGRQSSSGGIGGRGTGYQIQFRPTETQQDWLTVVRKDSIWRVGAPDVVDGQSIPSRGSRPDQRRVWYNSSDIDNGSLFRLRVTISSSPVFLTIVGEDENNFIVTTPDANTPVVSGFQSRSTTTPFTRSTRWRVDRGQYDVRVRRTRNPQGSGSFDDQTWDILRTFRDEPPVLTDELALIAMRIRATEMTAGTLDRVNLTATSVVPSVWEEDWSQWRDVDAQQVLTDLQNSGNELWQLMQQVVQGNRLSISLQQAALNFTTYARIASNAGGLKESQNAAELIRWLIQGPFLKTRVPNSKLDLDGLEYFRDFCATEGLTANGIIEREKTLARAINAIASTSFGELKVTGEGQYSVTVDEPREFYTASITFKNARNLSIEREYLEPIDGFRVEFDNEELDFETDEVHLPYDDLEEVTGNYERIKLWGVTNYEQVVRIGRRQLAQRRLQQEAYSFQANIRALDVTRGDVILLQIPTVSVGKGSGWVRQIDGQEIVVDEVFEFDSQQDYALQIIKPDGAVVNVEVVTVDGNVITVSDSSNITTEDFFLFGLADNVAVEALVQEVRPNADFTFDVKLVKYDPAIYDVDTLPIPEYGPLPDIPEVENNLPVPTFRYITVLPEKIHSEGGKFLVDVEVGIYIPSVQGVTDYFIEFEWRRTGSGDDFNRRSYAGDRRSFLVTELRDQTEYDFRVRLRQGRSVGPWVSRTERIQIDPDFLPRLPKVNGLEMYGDGNEFNSPDVKIIWRPTSNTRSYDLGSEPNGGDDGDVDPYFKDYYVEVFEAGTGQFLRDRFTKNTEFTYTFEDSVEDGGPYRNLRFVVRIRDVNGAISDQPASIRVNNPIPNPVTNLSTRGGFGSIRVSWDERPDEDLAGYVLHASTTEGFTPDSSNIVYRGRNNSVNIDTVDDQPVERDQVYYFRVAAFDVFGEDDGYNYSSEQSGISLEQEIADYLEGVIGESQLNTSLTERIDGFDDDIVEIFNQLQDLEGLEDFDEDNTYEIDDLVIFDGGIYIALQQMSIPPVPDPTDENFWQLVGQATTIAGIVAAQALAISDLNFRVDENEDGITANADSITIIQSSIQDIENDVSANSGAISTLETTVSQQGDDITSNASAITGLSSDLSDLAGDVTSNANAISSLNTQVSSIDGEVTALAQSTETLAVRVGSSSDNKVNPLNVIDFEEGWSFFEPAGAIDTVDLALHNQDGRNVVATRVVYNSGHQGLSHWFDVDADAIYEVRVTAWVGENARSSFGIHTRGPGGGDTGAHATAVRTVSSSGAVGSVTTTPSFNTNITRGEWVTIVGYIFGSEADTETSLEAENATNWFGFKLEPGQTRARVRLLGGYSFESGTEHEVYLTDASVRRISDPVQGAIRQESIIRATETGELFAQYTVKIDDGDRVAGFGLASEPNEQGPNTFNFIVLADNFAVGAPGASDAFPFAVDTVNNRVIFDADQVVITGTLDGNEANFTNIFLSSITDAGALAGKNSVGSSNILRGSFLEDVGGWGSSILTINSEGDFGNRVRVETNEIGNRGFVTFPRSSRYVEGQEITLSFEARGNIPVFNYTYLMRTDGSNSSFSGIPVSLSETEWTKVTATRMVPWTTDKGYLLIGRNNMATSEWFEVRKVKIEEGDTSTSWSPNVADVNAGRIEETDDKKWAGESGANVTENHTSADTNNVNGVPSSQISDGANRAIEGLNSSGDLQRLLRGSVLPTTNPPQSGLAMNGNYMGFWNGSSWANYFRSNGDALIGDEGTDNFIFWDQSAGVLNVRGSLNADDITTGTLNAIDITGVNITGSVITGSTLRTAASGERFEINEANNRALWYNASDQVAVSIGETSVAGGLYAITIDHLSFGIYANADLVGGVIEGGVIGLLTAATTPSGIGLQTTGYDSDSISFRIINGIRVADFRAGPPNAGYLQVNKGGWRHFVTDGPLGAVGTVMLARYDGGGSGVNFGDTVAGSDLLPASAGSNSIASQSYRTGTWRCLGMTPSGTGSGPNYRTLWVRIA